MGFKGIQRDLKEFKGNQGGLKGFKGIQRDSKGFKEILWDLKSESNKFKRRIQRYSKQF